MKADSIVDAVSLLRETGFAPVAKAYDQTGDLQEMEFVLLKGEIAMYQEVAKYLEGQPSQFVLQLLGKIEEDNLKNGIRLWYSSIVRMHSIRYRSEYLCKDKIVNDINWAALINATNWDGVVNSVRNTFYYEVLSKYTQDMIHEQGLFDMEVALDKVWYTQLMESCQLLSPTDRKVAMDVFLVDFDLKNILNLIRFGWYHKLETKHLESTLFPWGKLYGSQEARTYMDAPAESRDPVIMLKRFYPDLVGEIQQIINESKDGSHSEQLMARETLRLEQYLQARRAKEYHVMLAYDPFTIGVALSYFFLYKGEDSMIRAILNGKYYGYSETYIREVLG